ncbi:MAG TPA: ABC transporter ATP-binding protein [Chloroflexota bacterium]|nr:ABC transporter ATP-binding protein [Chloroflexota bacterium]
MTKLQIRGLSKAYPGQPVLHHLDMDLEGEEIVAILGPSGCGKTTLLRLIGGFERADEGTIVLDGAKVCGDGVHVPPERRRIGFVPQEGALFPHLTVAANVGFGLRKDEGRDARIAEVLRLVGLEQFGQRMPHELSGGQQQRVALARALAPRPELLLLDEPFSSLDTQLRVAVREDVRQVLEATKTSSIMVTHDQNEAFSMADRVGIMRGGRLVQLADPQTLYWNPVDVGVAQAGGDAILVPGVLKDGTAESAFGVLRPRRAESLPNGPATLMIRPEQLRAEASGDGPSARVLDVRFLGNYTDLRLELLTPVEGERVIVTNRIRSYIAPAPGAIVTLHVEGEITAFPGAPDLTL